MNDFFTELDSDLLGAPKTPVLPKTPIVQNKPHIPRKNIAPIQKREPRKPAFSEKRQAPIPNHIVEMRSQMMEFWTIVIVFRVDEKTRTLLGNLKLETRWFAHPEEVRELHKMVIKKAKSSYEETMKDIPDIEEKDLLKIIRNDLETLLQNRLSRNPVIIPIILSV